MDVKFENNSFKKRLKSMLSVDFKRLAKTPFFYIMVGISLVIPILILVMTSMMDGTVTVDPQTGKETVMEGFDNVWQMIGTSSGSSSSMEMSITSMCNINMMFFLIAVLVCTFISDDFRSGYFKNLFTVRSNKSDYVISKTITCFVGAAFMLIAFFVGTMIGGAVSSLSFKADASAVEIVMCMLSKIFLSLVFVSMFVFASVFAKQKLWLSILLSLGIGMLMFTMVPIISPLNSTIVNVILCIVGGTGFAFGFGALSRLVLNKRDLY